MWVAVIFILPERVRLWLAQHPFVFLMVHIPFMVFITSIAGEGMLIGVSNLAAGLIAQVILARWGVHNHGLTWAGKRTDLYYELHPRLLDVDVVRKYVMVKRAAMELPSIPQKGGRQ
jgi:hypothetical protein